MLNPLLPPVIEPVELHQYLDARASALAYNTQALPPICIIDLSSEQSYRAGHIPNAVYLPPTALLSGRPPAPGKIPPLAQLEQVFGYLGLTSNTHFIVYDDEGGGWAGRFIWTLDVIGHPHYSYVNGGLLAWKKNALAVEQHEHRASATSPALNIHSGVIAEIPDILAELNNNNARIWDARSPEEFRGEKVFARKGGHIPGAINCEWTQLMAPQNGHRIRSDAEHYLQSVGLTKKHSIITHCQSHHRSGFTYLVGKLLGFNIKAYHGSWAEWGNHPNTPVEETTL